MKYKEYLVKFYSSEKKLGILGEDYVYTLRESNFAKGIVAGFDNIGHEGGFRTHTFLRLLYKLPLKATFVGTDRLFRYDTALEISKQANKRLTDLEKGYSFSNKARIRLVGVGMAATILSPLLYLCTKLESKEYFHVESESEEDKEISESDKRSVHILCDKERRDKYMAENTLELITSDISDLLVICGEAHLDGIVDIVSERISLELIREQRL